MVFYPQPLLPLAIYYRTSLEPVGVGEVDVLRKLYIYQQNLYHDLKLIRNHGPSGHYHSINSHLSIFFPCLSTTLNNHLSTLGTEVGNYPGGYLDNCLVCFRSCPKAPK